MPTNSLGDKQCLELPRRQEGTGIPVLSRRRGDSSRMHTRGTGRPDQQSTSYCTLGVFPEPLSLNIHGCCIALFIYPHLCTIIAGNTNGSTLQTALPSHIDSFLDLTALPTKHCPNQARLSRLFQILVPLPKGSSSSVSWRSLPTSSTALRSASDSSKSSKKTLLCRTSSSIIPLPLRLLERV